MSQWTPWTVPQNLQDATRNLCLALTDLPSTNHLESENTTAEKSSENSTLKLEEQQQEHNSTLKRQEQQQEQNSTLKLEEQNSTLEEQQQKQNTALEEDQQKQEVPMTIYWERDEYQSVVMPDLTWPEEIMHQRLKLYKNRYPLIPGLDRKTLKDSAHDVLQAQQQAKPIITRQDFLKKPSTWKVKNKVVALPDVLHRYGSKNGKSFPIIKTTAESTRFRFIRQAIKQEKEAKEKEASAKFAKSQTRY